MPLIIIALIGFILFQNAVTIEKPKETTEINFYLKGNNDRFMWRECSSTEERDKIFLNYSKYFNERK